MARRKDALMEDVRRIRRHLSKRLEKALKEGRLSAERQSIEREASRQARMALNGHVRNGAGPSKK